MNGIRCAATLLTILLFLGTLSAHAQSYDFTPVGGPKGGNILSVVQDRDGTLFIGSTHRIFRSGDEGTTWENIGDGIDGARTQALAIDSAGVMYASLYDEYWYGRIFRSTDKGVTWQGIRTGIPVFADISALMADHSGIIYAATRGSGMLRSTDQGMSWQTAEVRDARGEEKKNLYAVQFEISPVTGSLFTEATDGIYRSADSGRTWRQVRAGNIQLIMSPDGAIFSSQNTSLYRSDDEGITWTEMPDLPRGTSTFRMTPGGALLGQRNDTIVRSEDTGRTWQSAFVAPYATHHNTIVNTPDGDILIGTNQGIYRSRTDGRSWESLNDNLVASSILDLAADSSGGLLAVASSQGLFRSTDGGVEWTQISPPKESYYYYATTVATAPGNRIYTSALFDSLYILLDDGVTWYAPPYLRETANASTILASPDGLVLTETAHPGSNTVTIMRSTNYGRQWQDLNLLASNHKRFRFQFLPNGHLIAGTSDGVLLSTDTGASWSNRRVRSGNFYTTYGLGLTRAGAVLAATEIGLYRTNDEGITWDSLGTPFRMDSVRRFITTGSGRILALVYPGLYYSDDDGTTWETVDTKGYPLMQMVQRSNGDLFVGSLGLGVFRQEKPNGVADTRRNDATLTIRDIVPSADRETVRITYTIPSGGDITIALFDLRGAERISTTVAHGAGGTFSAMLAPASLPVGYYICRIAGKGMAAYQGIAIVR